MNSMQVTYPLKRTQPIQFADTLILNLEQTYNAETSMTFKPILTKINQLRNKVAMQINNPQNSDEDMDKTIEILSAYSKFANILLKRFNWNSDNNQGMGNIPFRWMDSFQKVESVKNTIAFDIYCCYYNLSVLYFMRALKLSQVDLDSSRKDAIIKAKSAAFVLKQIRQKYQTQFSNCGFHDTQPAHLATLQNLCLGLIYKCTFDTFKPNQYKVGINKIASIASYANRYFYKAFTISSGYFTNQASGIFDKTKTEILSLAFVQSLYFDVISNVKLAKHYGQLVQNQQIDKFPLVIGYQKKAYKVLEIALGNSNVEQLLNLNIEKKKQLLSTKQQLYMKIGKDIQRNNQIYQQKQIPQNQLPPADQLPPEMNINLSVPANLIMQNQGQFSKLMSAQSSKLALQLSNFAKSRKTMLDGSFKKLNDEVTKVFIDTGINFYLDEDSTIQTIPQSVKAKITQINSLGGKYKLQEDIVKIRQSPSMAIEGIKQMRNRLNQQQAWDQQKRMLYKQKWIRERSNLLNQDYYQKLNLCQNKLKAAAPVDQKVIAKYQKNQLYISILDQADQQICLVLPKVDKVNNHQNSQHVEKMRQIVQKIKQNAQQIDQLTTNIGEFLDKTNYAVIASDTVGKSKPKQLVFKETFSPLENKINQFNMQCKIIKEQVQQAASIAVYLNNNSKNMQPSKIQHQGVLVSFNQIYSLFNNFGQSLAFYDKVKDHLLKTANQINQYVNNRQISGKQLEDKIKGKGEPGGGTSRIISFPSIKPNDQQFDFNMFKYNPGPELQTPQEIKYTPQTPNQQWQWQNQPKNQQPNNNNQSNKFDSNQNGGSNNNQQQGTMDINAMLQNFCNILAPQYMNSMGANKN